MGRARCCLCGSRSLRGLVRSPVKDDNIRWRCKVRMRLRRGFTIIEFLVVLGLLAVLAAIIYPIQGRAKVEGLKTACLARQKQIFQALMIYGQDFPGYEMAHANVDLPATPMRNPFLLLPYLGNREMLYCPATPQCGKDRWGSTYVFSVGPRTGSSYAATAGLQHEAKFRDESAGKFPVIYSLIFDEVYYHPQERHLSNDANPPYLTYVTSDGSAHKGRYPVIRQQFLAYACGDSQ